MSWVVDSSLTRFQRFCMNIIKCGPIPKHLAFIMDGNRRFASKTHVQKTEGHMKGFEKLAETLQWCLELGIEEVTVYAFSIENFKRSKDEVDALLRLAQEKFEKLLSERDKVMERGICVRVIGNLALLPQELRKLVAEVMLLTKDNKKAILNVAFAYTSRDEIANTMKLIVEGVEKKLIDINDVTEDLVSNCLYTSQSPNPNILIRTSGELRISDYLIWQCSGSSIYFTDVLWPEFSIWHLLACIFKYQRDYCSLKIYQDLQERKKQKRSSRVENFLKLVHKERLEMLQSYLG